MPVPLQSAFLISISMASTSANSASSSSHFLHKIVQWVIHCRRSVCFWMFEESFHRRSGSIDKSFSDIDQDLQCRLSSNVSCWHMCTQEEVSACIQFLDTAIYTNTTYIILSLRTIAMQFRYMFGMIVLMLLCHELLLNFLSSRHKYEQGHLPSDTFAYITCACLK